jgi:GTP pyrophosphokinase
VDLPSDATTVDFAYAIHSEIGDHMIGAKVNGKLVSMDTVLRNGDIVEIETKEHAKPSHRMLDLAKTTLAKKHIKTALDTQSGIKL